jgi:putative peptidoglycan binding protein
MKTIFLGVLPDDRTKLELESVVKHEEIAGVTVPDYFPDQKSASQYVDFFPYQNQNETGECMPHGHLLCLAIFRYVNQDRTPTAFSPTFIYRKRINYPSAGMTEGDVQNKINEGVITFENLPTPQDDSGANAVVITPQMNAEILPISGITWVEPGEPTSVIDALAIVSNTFGLGATIIIFATEAEWSQEYVTILEPGLTVDSSDAAVQHCICVLPKSAFIDANGKKWVIVQDSFSVLGGYRTRIISEDFLAARVKNYSYVVSLSTDNVVPPAKFTFTQNLTVGATGPQVTALQQWLQALGFMPTSVNGQPLNPTGYYGGLTKAAVLAFQNAHPSEILTPNNLTVGTGYFGNSTRVYLNTISS